MSSWVKVSRKLLTSAIASKPEYLAVWLHLLLSASYKPGEVLVGHQVVKLEAGQLVFGRIKFSQQIGVSEHTLRMALKTLEKLQQITIKSESKFSVISITNWAKYQTDSPANHQQPTSNQPATHHNKEVQETQEIQEEVKSVGAAGKRPRANSNSITVDQLVELGVDRQHAKDWITARKAALTKTALDAVANEAEKAGVTLAEAVRVSAERGWRGFKAEWYKNLGTGSKQGGKQSIHHGFDDIDYSAGLFLREDGSYGL